MRSLMSVLPSTARLQARFTTSRATNFYYSFLFLPREKRRAIESVYAFARRGDDLADGDLRPDEAAREIARYRDALDGCYSGRTDGHSSAPEISALAETVQRYKIPRRYFDDLILGLEMDLGGARYPTFDDLAVYCYRVAGAIGLISIEVFGYRHPETREYAVSLGTALQLVNILRDLQSDARRGRVYLPQEDLERFGVRPEDLAAGRSTDAFIELMQFECDRARHYFDRARQALPPEERRSMVAAEIMAATYWRLLGAIRQRNYNVFGTRVRLARPLKFWIALSVYLAVYLGRDWRGRD